MRGFVPPKFTKEDVRDFLGDKDVKTILRFMGYQIVPKCKNIYSYKSNVDISNRFITYN